MRTICKVDDTMQVHIDEAHLAEGRIHRAHVRCCKGAVELTLRASTGA